MRELSLMREKLKYQEQLYEKEMVASTAGIVDNLTGKLRDLAFDFGTRLVIQLISSHRKHEKEESAEVKED